MKSKNHRSRGPSISKLEELEYSQRDTLLVPRFQRWIRYNNLSKFT